jgi:hypothetical protein
LRVKSGQWQVQSNDREAWACRHAADSRVMQFGKPNQDA